MTRKPPTPNSLQFSATVESALAAYLQRLSPVVGVSAERAFTALAFAEAPGLPTELWRLAIEALDGTQTSTEDLTRFARSSAANFLVEVGGQAGTAGHHSVPTTVYRLFHQALNDALLRARSDVMHPRDDEQALTLAFSSYGRASNWENAPNYLLRSLPGHADAAGTVDDLLCDDAYLLHADLRRLMQVADKAASAQGRRRAQLLRLTPRAVNSGAQDRSALFSVTETLDNLGTGYRNSGRQAPYQALWASVPPRRERAVLEGHTRWVTAVCPVTVAGRQLLASGGDDGMVRIWDPQTGEQAAVLEGHTGLGSGCVPGDGGGAPAAGQRRRRSRGADLGSADRGAGRRAGGSHARGPGCVPGDGGGAPAAGQRRRRSRGADLGSADRGAGRRAGGSHARGPGCVPGDGGGAPAAGQRRRRWHGADLGSADRGAGRRAGGSHARGPGCVPGDGGGAPAAGQRRRRWRGADLGSADRGAGRRAGGSHARGPGCVPGDGGGAPAAGQRRRRSAWCGSGIRRPGSRPPCWRVTRAGSGLCAR